MEIATCLVNHKSVRALAKQVSQAVVVVVAVKTAVHVASVNDSLAIVRHLPLKSQVVKSAAALRQVSLVEQRVES